MATIDKSLPNEVTNNARRAWAPTRRTGEAIKIPAKTVVKARVVKQLKDAVLPHK